MKKMTKWICDENPANWFICMKTYSGPNIGNTEFLGAYSEEIR